MSTYVIYERDHTHTHLALAHGSDLRSALLNHLAVNHRVYADDDGNIIDTDAAYEHPLEWIEANLKFDSEYDEIQIDPSNGLILIPRKCEVRKVGDTDLTEAAASIFTSADAWNVNDDYTQCRAIFEKEHPDSTAKSFFWHLVDGTLISFAEPSNTSATGHCTIVPRYTRRRIKRTYPETPVDTLVIEEWKGTFRDLETQLCR